uniref:Amino acid adenylation domain-containing protein/thioester reductase domain-containing protein n=1 Tax=Candidatus Kentrum sp. FW TaxID=2126338 RepID=A0A450TXZ5_9GAMM|nr:MAG: amino acid adenylation domain-containing protein/thioester reductase domain-containing protein [Candidatus Kentron sp. FW]
MNVTYAHRFIEDQVKKTPDDTAILFDGQHTSYESLNERANRICHHLRDLGVGKNTLVGLCMERSPDMIAGLLGIMKAGGGYVPLDTSYPHDRLLYMLEHSNIDILLTKKSMEGLFHDSDADLVCLDVCEKNISSQQSTNNDDIEEEGTDSIAYVLYTSGSTGLPKGIVMLHRALINLIEWQLNVPGFRSPARTLQFSPLSFDVSFQEIFTTLSTGGTLILIDNQIRRDPDALLEYLINHRVERIFLPYVSLQQLAEASGSHGSPYLRKVITAGEQLRITPAIRDFFGSMPDCRLYNQYGPTETHVVTSLELPKNISKWPNLPAIGYPVSNADVFILDEDLEQVEPGNSGEIYIGGICLAREYFNDRAMTENSFIFHGKKKQRLFKTGDFGEYAADGSIRFLGRHDGQVKIRGFRVELGEIEGILHQSHLIENVVVMASEDQGNNKKLVAYVACKSPESCMHEMETQHVDQWRELWDEAYKDQNASKTPDDDFHAGGWVNTYTKSVFPEDQLREWIDNTVERILSLQPKNILEIGCGTGLILFRLAPVVANYLGTDISRQGIKHIEKRIKQEHHEKVKLLQMDAKSIDSIKGEHAFDTIIINGVIQDFPNVDYLVEVLEKCISLLEKGGCIFVGDVHNLSLLRVFHTSVQLYNAIGSFSTTMMREDIDESKREDKKLWVDPGFFITFKRKFQRISHVHILLNRGNFRNELTGFRYDVIIYIDEEERLFEENTAAGNSTILWKDGLEISDVRDMLIANNPEIIKIANIPNPRLFDDVQADHFLYNSRNTIRNVKELKEIVSLTSRTLVEPETWWELKTGLPYNIHTTWSGDQTGCYDVIIQRADLPVSRLKTDIIPLQKDIPQEESWASYANTPLLGRETFSEKLRDYAKRKLPNYMVPSSFVILDSFSFTPSGKLDKRALPAPDKKRHESLARTFVPPHTVVEAQLCELWSNVLDIHPIGIKDNFFEIGGHSLLVIQLLSHIRETFRININFKDLFENTTVYQLSRHIESARTHQAPDTGLVLEALTVEELNKQVALNSIFTATSQENYSREYNLEEPKAIFLTGVTGFIGAFLLEELLRKTNADIYCLLRHDDNYTDEGRIRNVLARYFLEHLVDNKDYASRIITVRGDLSKPLLGIDDEHFQDLARKIDSIYHLAANVNTLYHYDALANENVQGTREILRLATSIRLKPIHYVSSVGIFESLGYYQGKMIQEETDLEDCGVVWGGYGQTKWVSERILEIPRSRGVPIVIYRPAMVSGHSVTGASNIDDMLSLLLKYFIETRKAPNLDRVINMTPVDYVVQSIFHLSMKPESIGMKFHLSDPNPSSIEKLIERINIIGFPIELIEYEEWLSALLDNTTSSLGRALGGALPLFSSRIPGTDLTYLEVSSLGMTFDCKNTLAGLRDTHIIHLPVNIELLRIYFSYFMHMGFIKRL